MSKKLAASESKSADPQGITGTDYGDNKRGLDVSIIGGFTSSLEKYITANIDEISKTLFYFGKQTSTGIWLLQKLETSSNVTTISYANIGNNATQTTYTLAWTNRLTLTYQLFENLTDV